MRCSFVQSKIEEYLDGGLSKKARNEIERHLSQCPECRKYRDLSLEIVKTAPSIHSAEADPDWSKVSAEFTKIALERKTGAVEKKMGETLHVKKTFKSFKLAPLFSAVAAVLIFGLLFNAFIIFVTSSNVIADENDLFLMKQIMAAETIYKANIKSLKEEFASIKDSLPEDTVRIFDRENKNLDKTIKECSRLAMIQPSNQLLVKKLFESYRFQVNMHKNLIINIKTLEA